MKRLLQFLALLIFCSNFYAQLDREHWFAPMIDRTSNGSQYQSIYLSTPETTPFKVDIYNNNVIVGTVTISKGNPVKYSINTRKQITTTSQSDMFKPVPMGFYLKGEKPFFASLRFSVLNHAEIQTSKGSAGVGKEFRAVMAPITVYNSILNFMNSVMATEDNTTVTITGFNSNVHFSDGVNRSSLTFTLNKGQSYIIDGIANYSSNYTGYIGAKISATKPVVIANGNFNGQYAGNISNSSDILMDQGVPTDKLGQDFVLMKGNGNLGSDMEKALVVANEDNTQVFLNNNPVPVATLNAGQFYTSPDTAYINQGYGHYNMFVHTSKNAYVYQLLAGDSGSSEVATGGMNYIPPLSCYLPRKIDEIGKINENEYSSNGVGYSLTVPTKLNIITEKGATISVQRNGANVPLDMSNGPFNVLGNGSWVTYSIPNISGNVAVISSHAVTAGISAGNDAVGYGGYFAGFSYIPAIIKREGDCLPGVKLEITEGFSHYLWVIKNPDGTYSPAPGVNNTNVYLPPQAGIYAVQIQQGSCAEIQTQDFKFYNCTTYTNVNYDICSTQDITPSFALSSQTLNAATIKIDTPPTKGTATVVGGIIKYVANPNATGTDTFKYSFCGNGAIPDCETVQATLNLNQIEKYDVTLNECSTNGTATYNLSNAAVTPQTGVTKTYYKTLLGAQNETPGDVITNFTNYTTADTTVYVRIKNTFGCFDIAKIELKSKLAPDVKANLYVKSHCDEDVDGVLDGIYKVDPSTITPVVLANAASFNVKYYDSLVKANAGGTDNITGIFSFSTNTSIWIRVDSPSGCPVVVKEIPLKIGNKLTLLKTEENTQVCSSPNTTPTINLSQYVNVFYAGTTTSVKYFSTLADAQNNTNAIAANQSLTGPTSFYYRIAAANFCENIGKLNVSLANGTPSTSLLPSYTICSDKTVTVDVGPGYTHILWPHNGSTTRTQVLSPGTYTVELTNATGCVYVQTVVVNGIPPVALDVAAFNGVKCDTNLDGSIEVNFLTDVTPIVVPNAVNATQIRYFANLANATAGVNALPNNWSYTTATTVYIRVDSQYCDPVIAPIPFGFSPSVPLLATDVTQKVCDDGLNNTESVDLSTYIHYFTTDPTATARYFDNLTNAKNNTGNIPANQTITGDKTFYFRISAASGCDVVGTLKLQFKKPTPSTSLLPTYTICDDGTTMVTLNVGAGYTQILWSTGATTQTISVGKGDYWVELTNADGCVYKQNVSVKGYPVANPQLSLFNGVRCDENFDGKYEVKFSTEVTAKLLADPSLFTISYHLNPGATDAALPDNWTFTANTTVYMKIVSPYCPTQIVPLQFTTGSKISLIKSSFSTEVCDDDLDGIKSMDLSQYKAEFTTNNAVTVAYFKTLSDAQKNINAISNPVDVTGTQVFYLRFSSSTACSEIGMLTIKVKAPKASSTLKDVEICPQSTTTLDAGAGFQYYKWFDSNNQVIAEGANARTVVVGVGTYHVELTTNGCPYTQQVKVSETSLPEIVSIEVQGTTVIVTVTGGNPPYQYSLDGINYQSSNIFNNVPYGQNTVYVISAENCNPVTQTFTVIRLLNVITPNGDGFNDYLDYSDLNYKNDVVMQIFDRNGALIFTGNKANYYTWDGKQSGRPVPSTSYWYVIQWKDPGSDTVTQYKGWVLVKNRNND